jgi:hypothetical protein
LLFVRDKRESKVLLLLINLKNLHLKALTLRSKYVILESERYFGGDKNDSRTKKTKNKRTVEGKRLGKSDGAESSFRGQRSNGARLP